MAKRPAKGKSKGQTGVEARARRMRFAHEYVKDRKGSAAAVRAGYSLASSRHRACKLLKDPEVQAFIAQHEQKMAAKLEITAERVLLEFARIGFADIRDIFDKSGNLLDASEISEDAARSIASVEVRREARRGARAENAPPEEIVKVRLLDKVRALEALAKHTGVLKEPPPAPGGANWQLDPERLALMSDADVDNAIRVGKMLTGAV